MIHDESGKPTDRLLYTVLSVVTTKQPEIRQGLSINRLMLSVRRSPTEVAAETRHRSGPAP